MRCAIHGMIVTIGLALIGCTATQQPTGQSADVATKAQRIADEIGGQDGFGGSWMNGYGGHMAAHMGFHNAAYLADPDVDLNVQLINESDWPCTFHLAYIRSAESLDEQYEDVTVPPGQSLDFPMPCVEILGIGSVDEVGVVAADLGDGEVYDNWMCVPGFLNSDFLCNGTYTFTLSPDSDDLDSNGDTEELIVTTDGLWSHMGPLGMRHHRWAYDNLFGGMMGGFMMDESR